MILMGVGVGVEVGEGVGVRLCAAPRKEVVGVRVGVREGVRVRDGDGGAAGGEGEGGVASSPTAVDQGSNFALRRESTPSKEEKESSHMTTLFPPSLSGFDTLCKK